MGFGNRMALAVLSSPLHRMVSRSLMALTYEGRRSGKTYTLPLQYLLTRDGLVVWAGNGARKTWWRNFETPREVTVRLRGAEHLGKAEVVADVTRRADLIEKYLAKYPFTTPSARPRFFGERWRPDQNERRAVATDAIFVAVTLDE